jgi:hypothetical protein
MGTKHLHRLLSMCVCGLAGLYTTQGPHKEAEALFNEALSISPSEAALEAPGDAPLG